MWLFMLDMIKNKQIPALAADSGEADTLSSAAKYYINICL